MGNQSSSSNSDKTSPYQQESTTTNTAPPPIIIPKLSPPETSFLDLPITSFRIQELFVESRYCRYLRDVMTTMHYSPQTLQQTVTTKENRQTLYALYWSCLLSAMDRELNACLPATVSLDKMASDLIMSRFDPKMEGALMNHTVVKCHDRYFDRYEQFIDKHFVASQSVATQDQLEDSYRRMLSLGQKEKLDIGPPKTPPTTVTVRDQILGQKNVATEASTSSTQATTTETTETTTTQSSTPSVSSQVQQHLPGANIQQQVVQQQVITVSPEEAAEIRAKFDKVSQKYCQKPSIMLPQNNGSNGDNNETPPQATLVTPQQFEEYYRYRLCVISHMCSSSIGKCMKNEKKGLLDCINHSPDVTSECVSRLVKSGIEL